MADAAAVAAALAPPAPAQPHSALPTNASASTPATVPSSAPALASSALQLLALFMRQPDTAARLHAAVGEYLDAAKALKEAEASLVKFDAACKKDGGLSLPRSLQLALVTRARLPTVAQQPAFFDETKAALLALERETHAQVYKLLHAAKQRHLQHLRAQANPQARMSAASAAYREFVTEHAAEIDARFQQPSLLPVDQAVTQFEQLLVDRMNEAILQSSLAALSRQPRHSSLASASTLPDSSSPISPASLHDRRCFIASKQRSRRRKRAFSSDDTTSESSRPRARLALQQSPLQ